MIFFRNLLFYAGLVPITILFSLLGLSFYFMPYPARYFLISRWSHFFIFWAKIVGGISYRIEGLEHLPNTPAILVANHQSMWETVFTQILVPRQSWILKKSLLHIPFFGWGLALLEPIAIDRQDRQGAIQQIQEQGQKCLAQGRWIVLFPEGTRVAPGVHHRFSKSAAALSKATGYPIVPMAHNAGCFWPRGFWIRGTGTIQVHIGPAILPEAQSMIAIHESVESWVRKQLNH